MKIDFRTITEFLPAFVPAIVLATMATCEACALGRELTDAEIGEIMDCVMVSVSDYVESFQRQMERQGTPITVDEYNAINEAIRQRVYENAWLLIQRVVDELRRSIPTVEG